MERKCSEMALKQGNCAQLFIAHIEVLWPDYQITLQEYLHPTSDTVIRFLDRFLATLNVNVDELFRKRLNSVPNAEAYREIVYLITLYNQTRKFFSKVNTPMVVHFEVGSLLHPTLKVTNLIFKYIENFLMFQNNFESTLNVVYDSFKEAADTVDNIMKYQYNTINNEKELARTHISKEAYKSELRDKLKIITEGTKEIIEKNKKVDVQLEHYSAQSSIIDKKYKEIIEQKELLEEETERNLDYEKMLQEREVLSKEIEELTQKCDEITQTLKMKIALEEGFKARHEADIFSESLNCFLNDYTAGKVYQVKLKNTKQQINNILTAQSIATQTKNEEFDMQEIEKNAETLEIKWKHKKLALQMELQKTKDEVDELEMKKNKNMKEISNISLQRLEYEKAIAKFEEQERTTKQHWLKNYNKVLESHKALHHKYKNLKDTLREKN